MPFPHEGENYTYIVFNPEAIQPGITSQNSSIAPRSGEKCLMSMYSRDGRTYYDTDDWLISPMLSGEAQTILFWANNGQPDMTNVRYPQTIEVLYSDKTADHADSRSCLRSRSQAASGTRSQPNSPTVPTTSPSAAPRRRLTHSVCSLTTSIIMPDTAS